METNKQNIVLEFFEIISKIPRRSGNEEKIANYLETFAEERNLQCNRDSSNNVIIIKEASQGYEIKESIILQCHTDMVCEKLKGINHDFNNDAIETYIDGDYIKANGTTLGADNGVGVAMILAILDDFTIQSPRIEAIFTTEEETTMNGAKNIKLSNIEASKMICLDNMSEEELWTGCASHNVIEYNLKEMTKQKINDEDGIIDIKLSGLLGGHSGIDIDKNRGNSIKLMNEILRSLEKESKFLVKSIRSAGKENVIPRECSSEIVLNKRDIEMVQKKLLKIKEKIKNSEIENAEKIQIEYTLKQEQGECFDEKSSRQIIDIINEIPNGVYNRDEFGNTLVSLNIGVIEVENNKAKITFSIRSNREKILEELMNKVNQIKNKYNINDKTSTLLGYEHKGETDFIKVCKKLYIKNFNREPKLIDMHVGLEAGFFNSKIPNLDFIAIAPNIYNAHSPQEMCSISSIERVYKYLLDILKSQ